MKFTLLVSASYLFLTILSLPGSDLHVPDDFSRIQDAIDAASSGDRIILAPATYRESVLISEKSIVLASSHILSGDENDIKNTHLCGLSENGEPHSRTLVRIGKNGTRGTRITGLTIENGDDGISCSGVVLIDHNRFFGNKDAIDYEGGGGICRDNLFENNRDDAIDLDGPTGVRIYRNKLLNNRDDGIEIRLNPYQGPELVTVIFDNLISGNGEDGIQFIDYDEASDRVFIVQENKIFKSGMAGIAFMSDAVTKSDYRAAELDEPVRIIDNLIEDNQVGLSVSGNVLVEGNQIVRNHNLGILSRGTTQVIEGNVFSANGLNSAGIVIDWNLNTRTP